MVASVVQSASANTTTTPATITLGAAPTVGNTLLAIMASDTTSTAAPNAGTSKPYAQRLAQVGGQGFYVWTRLVVSGDAAATSFTPSGANPACLMVIEIQGTYDVVGVGTTTTGTSGTSRTTTTLTPTTSDNLVVAIAGLHALTVVTSGGTVNNTFSMLRTQFAGSTGATLGSVLTASRSTGAAAATGTTTISWTGNASDYDGVQIAFTGTGGAAAATPIRRIGKRTW